MQDPQELGGEPGQMPLLSGSLSGLAEEAGKVSLHHASKDSGANKVCGRQSGADVAWVRTRSHLPPSDEEAKISGLSEGFSTFISDGPDPGEHSSAWGQFEGFRESSAKSKQFSQFFELPERATAPQLPRTASVQKECGSQQPHQGGPWVTGAAAISPSEPILSYENIFRFAFQEVPVQQMTDNIPTLHHLLEIGGEEPGLGSAYKCWPESRKLWRALQSTDCTTKSRCLWGKSRCRENIFLVLGVDAAAQNLSGGQGHGSEGSEFREPAEVGVSSLHLPGCRALIQTKEDSTGSRPRESTGISVPAASGGSLVSQRGHHGAAVSSTDQTPPTARRVTRERDPPRPEGHRPGWDSLLAGHTSSVCWGVTELCTCPMPLVILHSQFSGTPGDSQGSLITYSLFLQTPFCGHGRCTTAPRRKLFSPANLKMTLFHGDVC